MLLAYIEDIEKYPNPRTAPAYRKLVASYGFSDPFLESLFHHTKKIEPFPNYPEEALLDWELSHAEVSNNFEGESLV